MKTEPIILSICIPTYNRAKYIDCNLSLLKQEIKDLPVELLISDNCSTDYTKSVVEKQISNGLVCNYYRNAENLGSDRNFINCYKKARGKYVWLLGDDDYLVPGALKHLLDYLSTHEFGLLHINNIVNANSIEDKEFSSVGEFFSEVGVLITFISSNIIRRDIIDNVNHQKYIGSHLLQVAYYCRSAASGYTNVIYSGNVLQVAADGTNNGGYNFFEVFVKNLLTIYHEPVEQGLIKEQDFQIVKKSILQSFVIDYFIDLVIIKKNARFKIDGASRILFKYYWKDYYFYRILIMKLLKRVYSKILEI